MLVNPLFNQDEAEDRPDHKKDQGYALPHRKGKTIQPVSKNLRASHYTPVIPAVKSSSPLQPQGRDAAVELIRQKVASLYTEEPDIKEELAASVTPPPPLSKHQQFMQELSNSGKPLAQVQTEWHTYYLQLPDEEKHAVWREFYQSNNRQPSAYTAYAAQQPNTPQGALAKATTANSYPAIQPGAPKAIVGDYLPSLNYEARKKHRAARSQGRGADRIKKQLLDKVSLSAETQKRAKEQLQSLVFGLGTGLLVLAIFLFGFFNEVIIAPFIQPSRHVSATPIIVTSDSVAASDTSEVIIPKINVQIPTVFDSQSVDESDIQSALERGVTHYPSTALPGQQGNTAFFGHSSNNIFNKGKYKFAFVLLHQLLPGDIFYLTYNKQVYTYKVYDKRVVPPSEVSVLDNVPGKTTATLITCDPPGTSTNRLVVWGEQISPDPAGAAAPSTTTPTTTPTALPSEGPTLWSRFWGWLF